MGLQTKVRENGNITVIELGGRLTFGDCPGLRKLVEELVGKQLKKILLNLRGLQYLDSSGVGELVRSYCTIKKHGGEVKIVHLTPKVDEVLRITNTCFLFEDYADEDSAVHSFARPA